MLPERQADDVRKGASTQEDLLASSPAQPASPLPGRWTHYPRKRPLSKVVKIATGVLFVGCVALTFVTRSALPIVAILPQLLPFLLKSEEQIASKADMEMLEDPDDPEVCLVVAEIVVDHETVGTDRGIAWFEGGRLLFSGHGISFALGGEDVLPRKAWRRFDNWTRGDDSLSELEVPLDLPDRAIYVSLTPVLIETESGRRQEAHFRKRLYEFRLHPPSSHGAPRQWPPFERPTKVKPLE